MRAYKNVVATINAQLAREAAANGYLSPGTTCTDDDVLALARKILDRRIRQGDVLGSPAAVRDYLRVHLAMLEHEEFHALFVDVQNRLICHVPLFRGTLTQTSVYPREVIKSALQCNAAAVLFAHNHPSGTAQPSQDDRALTTRLRSALDFIGVRVLDHFIVAGASGFSFAESGLL